MNPLDVFGLWPWIEANRAAFEPPVGNKVIWNDSQFTAMVIRGPEPIIVDTGVPDLADR